MHYWNGGGLGIWGDILMSISMLLVWGAIIAGIVLLARSLRASNPQTPSLPGFKTAEDVLAERFARGEIDAAEYQARLAVLRGRTGT